jgi:predicted dinucleotide-binding enzyme
MVTYGVLGSGIVAQVLARGLKGLGHPVQIGSRSPDKLADFSAETKVKAGTFAAVAAASDIVILAVKGTAAEEAVRLAGGLAGKIVVDATNPIADAPPIDGVLQFFTGPNESLMERLQAAAPQARFVKAFNSVGNALMINPVFAGGPPTMFYCGNDADAKAMVAEMIIELGWEPADMGSAVAARAIEPLCQLWCIPGLRGGGWDHAFRLLRQ